MLCSSQRRLCKVGAIKLKSTTPHCGFDESKLSATFEFTVTVATTLAIWCDLATLQ